MMNFGLAKAIRHRTAETVRMNRQRPGRMLSAMAEIQSAMILTAMVQLPSTLIGIMNRKIPTTEGTMNRALLTFFSISDIFLSLSLFAAGMYYNPYNVKLYMSVNIITIRKRKIIDRIWNRDTMELQ